MLSNSYLPFIPIMFPVISTSSSWINFSISSSDYRPVITRCFFSNFMLRLSREFYLVLSYPAPRPSSYCYSEAHFWRFVITYGSFACTWWWDSCVVYFVFLWYTWSTCSYYLSLQLNYEKSKLSPLGFLF